MQMKTLERKLTLAVLLALLAMASLAMPLHTQGGAVQFGLAAARADGGADGARDSAQDSQDGASDRGGDDGSDDSDDLQGSGADGGQYGGGDYDDDPDEIDTSAPQDDRAQGEMPPLGGLVPLN